MCVKIVAECKEDVFLKIFFRFSDFLLFTPFTKVITSTVFTRIALIKKKKEIKENKMCAVTRSGIDFRVGH